MKICTLCKGTGYIKQNTKEKDIIALRKKGLTIREIAKVVNLGSTTVFHHLKKYKNKRR